MLAKARREHRRWMLYTGIGLTVGLMPVAFLGAVFNSARRSTPAIPWPIYIAVVVALAAVGIGLIVGKFILANRYDPNNQDVVSRKKLGQARAMLREEFERLVKLQQEAQREQR
jgi:hypothetical protein